MKDLTKQLIKDFTEISGKHALVLLKFLDLKSHIEGTGIFDVDDESYEFHFSLKKLNGEAVKLVKGCTHPEYSKGDGCQLLHTDCTSCDDFVQPE